MRTFLEILKRVFFLPLTIPILLTTVKRDELIFHSSFGSEVMTNNTQSEIKFGFTEFAEQLNGRLAMIGFAAAIIVEAITGQGVLAFLGLK
jgi:hypothetical protein